MRKIANKHRVPNEKWRKWGSEARVLFNKVFSTVNDNQEVFSHPKTSALPANQWRTTAWNVAWIAADEVQDMVNALEAIERGG